MFWPNLMRVSMKALICLIVAWGLVLLAMFVNSLSSPRDSQLNESRFLELCRKATPGYGL